MDKAKHAELVFKNLGLEIISTAGNGSYFKGEIGINGLSGFRFWIHPKPSQSLDCFGLQVMTKTADVDALSDVSKHLVEDFTKKTSGPEKVEIFKEINFLPDGNPDITAIVQTYEQIMRVINVVQSRNDTSSLAYNKFQIGRVYNRRSDIHARFGGSWQGGISPSGSAPFVFIFTGDTGDQFGYHDDWTADGVFEYTGEGQIGDMSFVRGNKAIRDHSSTGKDLLLFKKLSRGDGYRFIGEFACSGWEERRGPDKDGNDRSIIVFHLVPLIEDTDIPSDVPQTARGSIATLDELRQRALKASQAVAKQASGDSRRTYYQRSADVKAYVLARADGVCEGCDSPAPFVRKNGTPYLEPHHTRRVSDGGPDHPKWVAALCPNCHRKIHSGIDGAAFNKRIEQRLSEIER
jgi:5-methylcytosine-specific restriction enzyme A